MASKQWLPKGSPAPFKAEVQASRKKQMVFSFLDCRRTIYTKYVPVGTKINSGLHCDVMANFLKVFHRKRPQLASGEWHFHWDNAPVHTATVTVDFLAKRDIRLIAHPPYSPDLAPADFFLFPKAKELLGGTRVDKQQCPE